MIKHCPQERLQWILEYAFQDPNKPISVNNKAFVDAYLDSFQLKVTHSPTGIPRCQQLARDLSYLLDVGELERETYVHTKEEVQKGFTRWSYVYYLSEWAYEELEDKLTIYA